MAAISLQEWIDQRLKETLPQLNRKYKNRQWANDELEPPEISRRLSFIDYKWESDPTVEDQHSATEESLNLLHKKIRGSKCETPIWANAIFALAGPLPPTIAHDLIDRKIASTALEHSRQVDEVQWRLAENGQEALLTLALELYHSPQRTLEEFRQLMEKFPENNWLMETLVRATPSSTEKEQIFLAAVELHPDKEHFSHIRKVQKDSYKATQSVLTGEEIYTLYATGEPQVWRALAENPTTPTDILEKLVEAKGMVSASYIRNGALKILKSRQNIEQLTREKRNMLNPFKLLNFPFEMYWKNTSDDEQIAAKNNLTIMAGEITDWFSDPTGSETKDNAPCALFTPPDEYFTLSARVNVSFATAFDAGVLQLRVRENLWAKLCYEYSPQKEPTIVSVVTRGVSDDCNSVPLDSNEVYLRISRNAQTFTFHYSIDGQYWHLVRYFTLGKIHALEVGFSAQSPTGQKCTAVFSEISYHQGALKDIRNGE